MTHSSADHSAQIAMAQNIHEAEMMGLRVIRGRSPRPWWRLHVRQFRVVAADIDDEAGVAAIWIARGRRNAVVTDYQCLYKKTQADGDRWEPDAENVPRLKW